MVFVRFHIQGFNPAFLFLTRFRHLGEIQAVDHSHDHLPTDDLRQAVFHLLMATLDSLLFRLCILVKYIIR